MTTIAYLKSTLTLDKIKNTINESIVVIFLLGVYNFLPYYIDFLGSEATIILNSIAIIYLVFCWFQTFTTKEQTHLRFYLLYDIVSNIFYKYFILKIPDQKKIKIIPEHKTKDLLFLFVKMFYIPVMLSFTVYNWNLVKNTVAFVTGIKNMDIPLYYWYSLITSVLFFIDTSFFLFGYLIESKKLNNTVRSVDTSFVSWIFTLACYPPFNAITTDYFPWNIDDEKLILPFTLNYILLIVALIAYAIYVSATISLGSKCSNLTNRGTVKRGPYKFVRHPAYASKVFAWWILTIPVMNGITFFALIMWTIIYIVRAIKEEDHLLRDPEYQNYFQKTPYRFIPKIL